MENRRQICALSKAVCDENPGAFARFGLLCSGDLRVRNSADECIAQSLRAMVGLV
jgi:hypothetical protein